MTAAGSKLRSLGMSSDEGGTGGTEVSAVEEGGTEGGPLFPPPLPGVCGVWGVCGVCGVWGICKKIKD